MDKRSPVFITAVICGAAAEGRDCDETSWGKYIERLELAAEAAASGIDGCLLTDLSVEEAGQYVGAMHRQGLDTAAATAPKPRAATQGSVR